MQTAVAVAQNTGSISSKLTPLANESKKKTKEKRPRKQNQDEQPAASNASASAPPLPQPQPTKTVAAAAEESNDVLYKALLKNKEMEQQRQQAMALDTRTITEAMLRKQMEAQHTKLAVSASSQYATNAKYVEVNSGKHPSVRVFSGMHALSPDEVDVYTSLVDKCPTAQVTAMHNHCMSEQGMIEGFRFTLDARANNRFLPINRRMFFRHSMVECHPSSSNEKNETSTTTSSQEERTILELLLRQNEVKDKLVCIMKRLHAESQNGNDADFDCMPMNMDVLDANGASNELQGGSNSSSYVSSFHSRRTADCKKWNPDMPELLGLYHAYVRGYNKDTRTHKLFIITTGGCSNLSDKFYNCSVDIRGSSMTADEVLESEEAYYLRRINGRNNARILKKVADELGLSIPSVVDTCSYDPYEVAVCTTETMVNDMHRQRDGRISVLVKCVDTTRVENGVLCCMHPAEGFWLFKGSSRNNTSMNHYGSAFGHEGMQTSMPSCMNRLHTNYSWSSRTVPGSEVCNRARVCSVGNRMSSNIAKVDRSGNVVQCGASAMELAVMSRGGRVSSINCTTTQTQTECSRQPQSVISAFTYGRLMMGSSSALSASQGGASSSSSSATDGAYTYMDEEYLRCLQAHMQWDRENGIIHLMPIAVVYQEDIG